ncbi:integrase [Nonomuraea phyllanthi]|uniref:integrase n=1 Tax=Nonomuraea phyllanthi TaxID=2219224 RepID=UPI00129374E8|nr:integrase [Nonomuraea phyllanthi]QFY11582.1 integrase [Nonomuraea phyllanthi]
MLDFSSTRTPWPRRLWDVSSFLALEELYEAGKWVDRRVLSQAAVDWQRHEVERLFGADSALGSKAFRRVLQDCLRTTLTVAGDGRRKLRHLIDLGRPGYLRRWAACVTETVPAPPEKVARAVTSHLLDSGHSMDGISRWLRDGRLGLSATDLIAEAAGLLALPPTCWNVVVPFTTLHGWEELAAGLPHWLGAREAEQLMLSAGAKPAAGVIGALAYEVEARDPERALEIVSDVVERLQARARFAAAGSVTPFDTAVVLNHGAAMPLRMPARGARVLSLGAERQLYVVGAEPQDLSERRRSAVDEALEIASALNHGPLAPAIAGGWSALESLLTEARDPDERERVVAASRAAALVACSWPRAELTALSYRIRRTGSGDLTERLDRCASNRERAAVIAGELEQGRPLPLERSWRRRNDIAAVVRMRALLADRAGVLDRVRRYVEISLRRLYRSRNIVLHGGSTGGVALQATLRVTAPLVGAALDRLTHADLVAGVPPLLLASRAETALRMVGDEMGPGICDLIE